MSIERYAAAIRQIESGGNYGALGPQVKKGRYKGDRAYGAYQVMGLNIPSWTKEALGYSMTKEQFLRDRKAQDKVFAYKFGKSVQTYGNASDAASVWHSGRDWATARRKGATDGYMKTDQYVRNFNAYVTGKAQISSDAESGFSTADTAMVQDALMQQPGMEAENAAAGAVMLRLSKEQQAPRFAALSNFSQQAPKRRFGGAVQQASTQMGGAQVLATRVQPINYGA